MLTGKLIISITAGNKLTMLCYAKRSEMLA